MLGNGQIVPYREKLDTYRNVLPMAKLELLRYNKQKEKFHFT